MEWSPTESEVSLTVLTFKSTEICFSPDFSQWVELAKEEQEMVS